MKTITIGDANGNRLKLPIPTSICRECLTDTSVWATRPVIAIFCEHCASSALWHPNAGKWVIVRPTTRADHVRGLALASAAQTLGAMRDGKPRH